MGMRLNIDTAQGVAGIDTVQTGVDWIRYKTKNTKAKHKMQNTKYMRSNIDTGQDVASVDFTGKAQMYTTLHSLHLE